MQFEKTYHREFFINFQFTDVQIACTRPSDSCNFDSLWKLTRACFFSKLHSKPYYFLYTNWVLAKCVQLKLYILLSLRIWVSKLNYYIWNYNVQLETINNNYLNACSLVQIFVYSIWRMYGYYLSKNVCTRDGQYTIIIIKANDIVFALF